MQDSDVDRLNEQNAKDVRLIAERLDAAMWILKPETSSEKWLIENAEIVKQMKPIPERGKILKYLYFRKNYPYLIPMNGFPMTDPISQRPIKQLGYAIYCFDGFKFTPWHMHMYINYNLPLEDGFVSMFQPGGKFYENQRFEI